MDTFQLEKKWAEVGNVVVTKFRSIKISGDCLCDLSIGINTSQERCLILSTHETIGINIKDELKDHVGLHFYDESGHLVITLFHEDFKELFNDLIISIYFKVKSIVDNKIAAKEMLTSFRTWCEFFNDSVVHKLSKEEIQGLFGEMFYLGKLLNSSFKDNVNQILRSWTGPYDRGQDFILDTKNIEVKTKDASQIEVNISSEFQLLDEIGKELHLHVISVESYSGQGQNLRENLNDVRKQINELQGDVSILMKALAKKALTSDNISQYDNWKFNALSEVTYNCIDPDFPRLIQTQLPDNIKKVRYSLRLSGLEKFIIKTIEY